jgi:hypothetical protein
VTKRAIFSALLWAIGLGTVLSLATGQNRAISIQVWLVGFTAWIAVITLIHLLEQVPVSPRRLLAVIQRPRKRPAAPDRRPFQLRGLEGLLIRSRDQDRAFTLQLRPHLSELAAHHLPRRHGINPAAEPDRVADLLGNVAWLIDPAVTTRAPSLDEVETFFDRLLPADHTEQRTST